LVVRVVYKRIAPARRDLGDACFATFADPLRQTVRFSGEADGEQASNERDQHEEACQTRPPHVYKLAS
jgi:hypothetical protein